MATASHQCTPRGRPFVWGGVLLGLMSIGSLRASGFGVLGRHHTDETPPRRIRQGENEACMHVALAQVGAALPDARQTWQQPEINLIQARDSLYAGDGCFASGARRLLVESEGRDK